MNERDQCAPIPDGRGGLSNRPAVTNPATDDLDNGQIRRWAEVIVNSDTSNINHFTIGNRRRIEAEARRLLQQRLMSLVARTIAQEITAGKTRYGD